MFTQDYVLGYFQSSLKGLAHCLALARRRLAQPDAELRPGYLP
jgi:hypothetical protein